MAGVGAMNFGLNDLYGSSYGFFNTRMQSIPEQDDQEALIDESETIKDSAHVDPKQQRSIFVSVAVILALVFFLSYAS